MTPDMRDAAATILAFLKGDQEAVTLQVAHRDEKEITKLLLNVLVMIQAKQTIMTDIDDMAEWCAAMIATK